MLRWLNSGSIGLASAAALQIVLLCLEINQIMSCPLIEGERYAGGEVDDWGDPASYIVRMKQWTANGIFREETRQKLVRLPRAPLTAGEVRDRLSFNFELDERKTLVMLEEGRPVSRGILSNWHLSRAAI